MLDNPSSLLKETIKSFEIEPDVHLVSQINKKINNLNQIRSQEILNKQDELNELTDIYETKLKEINDLELSSDRKKILEEINDLNNLKFKLAKNYLELENKINDLKLLINKKNQEFTELNNLNIINQEINNNPDSNVLKLRIYKNLGLIISSSEKIDLDNNDNDPNQIHNLIINNNKNNLTTTLTVDSKSTKLSDYFISNYIWDNL